MEKRCPFLVGNKAIKMCFMLQGYVEIFLTVDTDQQKNFLPKSLRKKTVFFFGINRVTSFKLYDLIRLHLKYTVTR